MTLYSPLFRSPTVYTIGRTAFATAAGEQYYAVHEDFADAPEARVPFIRQQLRLSLSEKDRRAKMYHMRSPFPRADLAW